VLDKLAELNVEPVVVDMTARDQEMVADLARADRKIIPVNIVYPSNYSPEKGGVPAILLEGILTPQNALDTLDIIEKFAEQGNK